MTPSVHRRGGSGPSSPRLGLTLRLQLRCVGLGVAQGTAMTDGAVVDLTKFAESAIGRPNGMVFAQAVERGKRAHIVLRHTEQAVLLMHQAAAIGVEIANTAPDKQNDNATAAAISGALISQAVIQYCRVGKFRKDARGQPRPRPCRSKGSPGRRSEPKSRHRPAGDPAKEFDEHQGRQLGLPRPETASPVTRNLAHDRSRW